MKQAQACDSVRLLHGLQLTRFDLPRHAVGALDTDQLSPQAFQSFRGVWQIARGAIAERKVLVRGDGTLPPTGSLADW